MESKPPSFGHGCPALREHRFCLAGTGCRHLSPFASSANGWPSRYAKKFAVFRNNVSVQVRIQICLPILQSMLFLTLSLPFGFRFQGCTYQLVLAVQDVPYCSVSILLAGLLLYDLTCIWGNSQSQAHVRAVERSPLIQ